MAEENTSAADHLKKGSFTAGGQTAIINTGSKLTEDNSFNLGVTGGYFVIDNLSVNGGLTVNGSTKWSFSQSIGASYYFLTQEKWSPYGSLTYSNFQPPSGSTINSYSATIGVVYFVLTHVAINLNFTAAQTDSSGSMEKASDGIYGGYSIYF